MPPEAVCKPKRIVELFPVIINKKIREWLEAVMTKKRVKANIKINKPSEVKFQLLILFSCLVNGRFI